MPALGEEREGEVSPCQILLCAFELKRVSTTLRSLQSTMRLIDPVLGIPVICRTQSQFCPLRPKMCPLCEFVCLLACLLFYVHVCFACMTVCTQRLKKSQEGNRSSGTGVVDSC